MKDSSNKVTKKVTQDQVKVSTPKGEIKTSKLKKKDLDKENIKDTIKQAVVSQREVKYKYPEDIVNDKDKKKTFRQQVRNKLKTLENAIAKAKPETKEFKVANRKLKAYREEVLLVPNA